MFLFVSLPIFDICFSFNGLLNVVGKGGKEVIAGDALDLVDGVDKLVALLGAAIVAHHEANGLGLALQTQHNLEEGLGDYYPIAAYGLVLPVEVDGAADDIYLAIFLRPHI